MNVAQVSQAEAARRRAEQLGAALPPLMVAAERVAATIAQGVHGRRRVGQGETFWQFRRYSQQDSAQLIDWRQSAKSDHLFVRETEWEAAESVWLWRDSSRSMSYASSPDLPSKQDRASLLLLALTSLLVRGGEHVALLGHAMAPSRSQSTLVRIATMVCDDPGMAPSAGQDGGLPKPEPLPRHAQLVMFGDFISPLKEVEAAVLTFARRGVTGHLFQVLDPAEPSLPFGGRVRFEGLEGEGEIEVRRVEAIRDAYKARVNAHIEGLQSIARSVGWTFALHQTDRPPELALLALYRILARI